MSLLLPHRGPQHLRCKPHDWPSCTVGHTAGCGAVGCVCPPSCLTLHRTRCCLTPNVPHWSAQPPPGTSPLPGCSPAAVLLRTVAGGQACALEAHPLRKVGSRRPRQDGVCRALHDIAGSTGGLSDAQDVADSSSIQGVLWVHVGLYNASEAGQHFSDSTGSCKEQVVARDRRCRQPRVLQKGPAFMVVCMCMAFCWHWAAQDVADKPAPLRRPRGNPSSHGQ